MDIIKIEQLVKLIENSNINELEVKEGKNCIRIMRHSDANITQNISSIESSNREIQNNNAQANPPDKSVTNNEITQNKQIKSPMVGTFYQSPSPNSEPFVIEGQKVNVGDTLCIIEAMKIMNRIEAESSGTINKILVENGSPVEYGQILFTID